MGARPNVLLVALDVRNIIRYHTCCVELNKTLDYFTLNQTSIIFKPVLCSLSPC
jgi:hypothetical protein